MLTERHLLEELNNVASTGRRGLHPGDTITHESAYELCRRRLIARRQDGLWEVTPAGERLLAKQLPAVPLP